MKKILFIILGVIAALVLAVLLIALMNPTFEETVSVDINASAEKTFAIFNNPENMSKWMDFENFQIKGIENISGNINEVGSKWKLIFSENGTETSMVETVTHFTENERFAFDLDNDFALFHTDITFTEKNGITTVTEKSDGYGKNILAKAMFVIFKGDMKKNKDGMYQRLKDLVEKS